MTVDELLNISQLSQTSENTWKVDGLVIPKTWGQGRTAFGGISAGMLYTAVKQQVCSDIKLEWRMCHLLSFQI